MPSMWREYTNDLPESCKGRDPREDETSEDGEDGEYWGDPVEANPITREESTERNKQSEIGRGTGLRPREPEEEARCDGGGEAGGCWGDPVEASLRPGRGQEEKREEWQLSHWIDSKPVQGKEEKHDRNLRKKGLIEGRERKGGVEGPDRLNYRGGNRQGGRECVLYADDTTAKVTGEVWPELEVKLNRT